MKRVLYITIFISLTGIIFSGCTSPKPLESYAVPTKCKNPDVDCNKYKHTGKSLEEELLMCIKEQKKASEVCK